MTIDVSQTSVAKKNESPLSGSAAGSEDALFRDIQRHSFIIRHERFGGLIIDTTSHQQILMNHSALAIAEMLIRGVDPTSIQSRVISKYDVAKPHKLGKYIQDIRRVLLQRFSNQSDAASSERFDISLQGGSPVVLEMPTQIFWEVTHRCNLRCVHCYNSSENAETNELNTTETLALIEEWGDLGVHKIIIGGGEPFCRPDILTIVENILSNGMKPVIVSNGTLLTASIVDRLATLGISELSISLDGGSPRTHDIFRGRKGSFLRAVNALRLLSERGFYVEVQTALSQLNTRELDTMGTLLESLGVKHWTIRNLLPTGRLLCHLRFALSKAQNVAISQTLAKLAEKHKGLEISSGIVMEHTVGTKHARSRNATQRLSCGAGFNTVGMTPDGRLTPCSYLTDDAWLSESIREHDFKQLWDKSPVFAPFRHLSSDQLQEECADCALLDQCRGGCRAMAYNVKGDFYARDPQCHFDSWDCLLNPL